MRFRDSLVIDRVNKNFAILPLDRDAMVSLEIPDEDGNILGENTMQLALAYAYGDGKEQSCELAEDAVSGLLHDQRIDGYVSLSMDAIGTVNHLVGGVDVTVTDDFAGESGWQAVRPYTCRMLRRKPLCADEVCRGRHQRKSNEPAADLHRGAVSGGD